LQGKTSLGKAQNSHKEEINKAHAYLTQDLGTEGKKGLLQNLINVPNFEKFSGVKKTLRGVSVSVVMKSADLGWSKLIMLGLLLYQFGTSASTGSSCIVSIYVVSFQKDNY
jgi:hypothetical protein